MRQAHFQLFGPIVIVSNMAIVFILAIRAERPHRYCTRRPVWHIQRLRCLYRVRSGAGGYVCHPGDSGKLYCAL